MRANISCGRDADVSCRNDVHVLVGTILFQSGSLCACKYFSYEFMIKQHCVCVCVCACVFVCVSVCVFVCVCLCVCM